jgi:hypothetical protein
MDIEMTKA